jgi:osmotically-inducible protein OsmY
MANNTLVSSILAALEHDKEVNLHSCKISVAAGEVVCLGGEVENIVIKRKALRIAKQITGNAGIEDHMRLRVVNQRHDKGLLNATVETLMQEPAFAEMEIRNANTVPPGHDRGWIAVSVHENVIALQGEVRSLSHRRLAEVICWWIPGCCDVKNRLHVHPAEEENDDEISDVVRLVFDKEVSLDAKQISIHTRDAEVTLRGVVHSEEQRRIATYDCWYIPGVHGVHNELAVRPRAIQPQG